MQKHLVVSPAQSAVNVGIVVTPRGLKVWHVESIRGAAGLARIRHARGRGAGPGGKAGAGTLLTGLLDEGAGDLDSQAFQRALDEKAVEMSFHCDRDHLSGRMRTLTKNLDRAAELLRLAVNAPRFDEEPFERVREHDERAPAPRRQRSRRSVANRTWRAKAFPGHPYGQPADGTLESLAPHRAADLVTAAKRQIARDELMIAVVGAIDERGAAELVDKVFADLPAEGRADPGRRGARSRGWARSTRSISTCRNRRSASAARP